MARAESRVTRRATGTVGIVTIVLLVSGVQVACGDFPEMVRRVPKDANVIVYMDVNG